MENPNLFLTRNLPVVEIYQDGTGAWISQCPRATDVTTSQELKNIKIGPPSAKFSINPLTDIVYPGITEPESMEHFVYDDICLLALDGFNVEEWNEHQNYGIATYLQQFLNLDVIFVVLNLDYDEPTTDERLSAPKTEQELSEKHDSEGIIKDFFDTCQKQFPDWKLPRIDVAVVQRRERAVKSRL
jgi:hypothetical protein